MPNLKSSLLVLMLLSLFAGCQYAVSEELSEESHNPKKQRLTRLLWQDRESKSIRWGDVVLVDDSIRLDDIDTVPGFPQLDKEKQELVQMEMIDGLLLTGVRDHDRGGFQSGWISIDSGAIEESHGDHMDYRYLQPPRITGKVLDQEQGNPAHLYVYDGYFYLANDQKNGLTRFQPKEGDNGLRMVTGSFHRGGGNHITMASLDNRICYSAWIDGGGPNRGRVDVVNLDHLDEKAIQYSFALPTGGIHGAIANSGRVFFAPQSGICWVDADMTLSKKPDEVEVHHIDLGKDEDQNRPHRTGAFVGHRDWILFTTGRHDDSALCLVKASAENPTVVKVPIPAKDGLGLVTPEVVVTPSGTRYAFIFQDRHEGEGSELLTVVNLDPNGDQNFSDAAVVKTLTVGASRLEGHYGHHSIAFDADHRWGIVTNPGDGEIWLLSLQELDFKSKFKVGGTPTKVCAVGGFETDH